jgi:hypothetical protein
MMHGLYCACDKFFVCGFEGWNGRVLFYGDCGLLGCCTMQSGYPKDGGDMFSLGIHNHIQNDNSCNPEEHS